MKNICKKTLSVAVAVLIVVFSCCTAFALESPTGGKDLNVTVHPTQGGTGSYEFTTAVGAGPNGGTLVDIHAKPYDGYTFEKWEIKGDYDIVKGSLTSSEIQVDAFSDLDVYPYYLDADGKPAGNVDSNTGKTSPKTGDASAVCVAVIAVMISAAGVYVVSRKIRNCK